MIKLICRNKKVFSLIVLLALIITGCKFTTEDLISSPENVPIINNHTISFISAHNATISYDGEDFYKYDTSYIEGHIYKYCYNDRYICMQRVKPLEGGDPIPTSEIPYDLSTIKFLVLDTEKHVLSDEMASEEEYNAYLIKKSITNLCNWIISDDLKDSKNDKPDWQNRK